MKTILIRDVPEDVHESLAERARERGQSLQSFLLNLVVDEARRSRNPALLEQFDGRHDGTSLGIDDVVSAIDAARAERDAELGERLGFDVDTR